MTADEPTAPAGPPRDLPERDNYAIVRSVGALLHWCGRWWHWDGSDWVASSVTAGAGADQGDLIRERDALHAQVAALTEERDQARGSVPAHVIAKVADALDRQSGARGGDWFMNDCANALRGRVGADGSQFDPKDCRCLVSYTGRHTFVAPDCKLAASSPAPGGESDFVQTLSSGAEPTSDPVTLHPQVAEDLDDQLREMEEARARAAASAQDYTVTGSGSAIGGQAPGPCIWCGADLVTHHFGRWRSAAGYLACDAPGHKYHVAGIAAPAEPVPLDQHFYKSTACQHTQHDRCRLVCKFCSAGCRCACHEERPSEPVPAVPAQLTDEAIERECPECYDTGNVLYEGGLEQCTTCWADPDGRDEEDSRG